ncbi:MAG: hypothetical protein AAFV53_01255 [Myxococcota bacterium]
MILADIETRCSGKRWDNHALRHALSHQDAALSEAMTRLGGKPLEAILDRPGFFSSLGVQHRNILCDPADPEAWWRENAGQEPFAAEGAQAVLALMRRHPPLRATDRVIVVGNGVDTVAPNIGYAVVAALQERRMDMEAPTSLALVGEGCSGFLSGLREASHYIAAHPDARVVVVTIEMMQTPLLNPWLHQAILDHADAVARNGDDAQRDEVLRRLKNLGIQRYLFGEGCAAALCVGPNAAPASGLRFHKPKRWANLDPADRHLLSLVATQTSAPPFYPPFGMFRQTPRAMLQRLVEAYLPHAHHAFQERPHDRPIALAVHTGSGVILDLVRDTMGVSEEAMKPSRRVLQEHGNMNATTGAAIIASLLQDHHRDIFALFFGVGFALQTAWLIQE